jgi:fatty-acyl-CoA synthase
MTYASLLDASLLRAECFPDETALIFVHRNQPAEIATFGDWNRSALAITQALQQGGEVFQKPVLIVMGHTPLLPAAVLGTMYSGAIAVPLPYITETRNVDTYLEVIGAMAAYYEAAAIITLESYQARVQAVVKCPVLAADLIDTQSEVRPVKADINLEHQALIIHSSGSTQKPKGAVFTHRALYKMLTSMGSMPTQRVDMANLTCLPLYHIGGLLTCLLIPIALGTRCVTIAPSHWTRSPKVWFQAIHDFRANSSSMPNSGFVHCLRSVQPEEVAGLDLSSLYVLGSSTEPTHAHVLEQFRQRFESIGFKPIIQCTYGMTENLGSISTTPLGESARVDWISREPFYNDGQAVPAEAGSPDALPVVSTGKAWWSTQMRVVSESGEDLPDRQIGEILCRSEHLFSGYFQAPDLTAETLRDGWLFTGDLGYMVGGYLYVTGRKKDLIIVGGKNIIPSDIEAIVNDVPGIAAGRTAAFGLPDASGMGTEQIAIAAELDPAAGLDHLEIERVIRQSVFQQTGLAPGAVHLFDHEWIVTTENGKLSRLACKEKLLKMAQP